MKKFDSISIFNYQPNLMSAHLNGLGKINVLCGKNSSGKSTVINAISMLSNDSTSSSELLKDKPGKLSIVTRRTNFSANDFDLSKVRPVDTENYAQSKKLDGSTDIKYFSKEFVLEKLLEYIHKVQAEDNSIGAYDFKEFLEFLNQGKLYKSGLPGLGIEDPMFLVMPSKLINELEDQILPNRTATKLIPTNRNLPNTCQLMDYKTCNSTGERIMNYIHYCKSQLIDSAEYSNFLELKRAFEDISEGLKFEIVIKNDLKLELLFSNREGTWINADYSGLGLRDLLVILATIILVPSDIILIEEPERHLHSSTQRRLLMYLSNQNKQFFIATHSNVFLDLDYVDTIFITEYINGQINVTNESSKARALMELGYSVADNIVSDLVILTEGPSDRAIIEHFLFELGALKSKIVKFWPLGGDIMDKHDLSVLKDSYHVIALVDNDPGSSVIRTRFAVKCTELGIKCHRLQRYSIENYITLEALKRQFSTQIPSSLTSIDPNIKLEDQIGSNVKNTLNRVVKHMTFSDVEETDLGEFILEVNRLLAQNPSTLKT